MIFRDITSDYLDAQLWPPEGPRVADSDRLTSRR
jgi:hypothetical protein